MTSSSSSSPAPSQPTRPSFFRSISSSSSVNNFSHELFPRKGKPRLYLALFPRGGSKLTSSYSSSFTCDSYHWTLVIGPETPARSEAGTCYQLAHESPSSATKYSQTTLTYDEVNLSEQSQAQKEAILIRVALAKVIDEDRLIKLLRSLPPSNSPTLKKTKKARDQCESEYDSEEPCATSTCLTWVKEAYKLLTIDGKCLRGYIGPDDWSDVEEVVRMYAMRKRRQGRFGDSRRAEAYRTWNPEEIATWNFWENRETTD